MYLVFRRKQRHSSSSSSSSTKSSASTDTASEHDGWVEKAGQVERKSSGQDSQICVGEKKCASNEESKLTDDQIPGKHNQDFERRLENDSALYSSPSKRKKLDIRHDPSTTISSKQAASSSKYPVNNNSGKSMVKSDLSTQITKNTHSEGNERKEYRHREPADSETVFKDNKELNNNRNRSRSLSSKSGGESNRQYTRTKSSEEKSRHSMPKRTQSLSDAPKQQSPESKKRRSTLSTNDSDRRGNHQPSSSRVPNSSTYSNEYPPIENSKFIVAKPTEKYRSASAHEYTRNSRDVDNSDRRQDRYYEERPQYHPTKILTSNRNFSSSEDVYKHRGSSDRRSIEPEQDYKKNDIRSRDFPINQMRYFDARQRLERRGQPNDYIRNRNHSDNRTNYNSSRTNFFPRRIVRHARQ